MSELDKLFEKLEEQYVTAKAERMVLGQLLATLIARSARLGKNPEEYIMTLTAPVIHGFDAEKTEGEIADLGFEHGVEFCNSIEADALSRLRFD